MRDFSLFIGLKNFLQGKIESDELEQSNSKIYKVIPQKDLRKSKIKFEMDWGKLEDLLGLSDDDKWVYQVVKYPYHGHNFYNSEDSQEDFLRGYGLWDSLNDENWKKLKLISRFLIDEPFSEDTDFLEKLAKKLMTLFPKQIDSILFDYETEMNNVILQNAEEYVDSDLEEFFKEYEVQIKDEILSMEVGKLYDLYLTQGQPYYSLEKILDDYFEDSNLGGWNTNLYEFKDTSKLDLDYLNREYGTTFDDILYKLDESGEKTKKFSELIDRITNKFREGKWYALTKYQHTKYAFRILGFNFEENLIKVELTNGEKFKTFMMTENNLNNLLYQPELFKFDELYGF